MNIRILNKNVSTSFIAISLTIFAFFLTIFFIVIFKVEDKTISIINFYEHPVKVLFKNNEYTIAPFDSREIIVNTNNSLDISVSDLEGKSLHNFRVDGITRRAQLVSMALSPTNGYCFFSANLINDPSGSVRLENKIILNTTPVNYAISDLNTSYADYSYPGKDLDVEENRYTKPVNYVYPLSCNFVTNDDIVISTISAFADYNPLDQLKYLQDLKTKIVQSENIESLESAISRRASKYYILEDKYLFLFE